MKKSIILLVIATFMLIYCKTSKAVSEKEISGIVTKINDLHHKYGVTEKIGNIDEVKLYEKLSSEDNDIDYELIEKSIVYIIGVGTWMNPGFEEAVWTKEIVPKIESSKSTDERLSLMQQYKAYFVVPDSLKYSK